jgi:hypothetical protein
MSPGCRAVSQGVSRALHRRVGDLCFRDTIIVYPAFCNTDSCREEMLLGTVLLGTRVFLCYGWADD